MFKSKSKEVYFVHVVYENSKGLYDAKLEKMSLKEAKELKKEYKSRRRFRFTPVSARPETYILVKEPECIVTCSDLNPESLKKGTYVKQIDWKTKQ